MTINEAILSFCLSFLVVILNAQNKFDCPPEENYHRYLRDATELSLRNYSELNTHPPEIIMIDDPVRKVFLQALSIIDKNENHLSEADTVARVLDIHSYASYTTGQYLARIDTSVNWTKPWIRNELLTTNQFINHLIDSFRLHFSHPSFYPIIFLQTPMDTINSISLAQQFESEEGIKYFRIGTQIGDGPDIKGEITDQGIALTYSTGWGDCPAGCIYKRYWKFMVNWDCRVDFVESGGTPLVSSFGNIYPDAGIKIYPNPAVDYFYVEAGETRIEDLWLVNTQGQKLKKLIFNQANFISEFAPGVYFITGFDRMFGLIQMKLIKL